MSLVGPIGPRCSTRQCEPGHAGNAPHDRHYCAPAREAVISREGRTSTCAPCLTCALQAPLVFCCHWRYCPGFAGNVEPDPARSERDRAEATSYLQASAPVRRVRGFSMPLPRSASTTVVQQWPEEERWYTSLEDKVDCHTW